MAKLCVALDVNPEEALGLVERLEGLGLIFKVGPKLLLEGRNKILEEIKKRKGELFLDLKFHDIPNTVRLAVEEARSLGIDYLTLHTLGGIEMMEWAASVKGDVKLLGVTLLTSHDSGYLEYIRTFFGSLEDMVLHLAKCAQSAGLDGVVCSAGELSLIKSETRLMTVVPGIRISGERGDQRRVFTPKEAARMGADIIVMGRDIYKRTDPFGVVLKVLEDINAGKGD